MVTEHPGSKDRRKHKRQNILEKTIAHRNGQPGRVVDISTGGMSVTYAHPTRWPDKVTLVLVLPDEGGAIEGVSCRKVWESGIEFVTLHGARIIKTRGMQFEESDTGGVAELFTRFNVLPP